MGNEKNQPLPSHTRRRNRLRARASLFAEHVHEAAERAAVDMGVPRHALKVEVTLDHKLLSSGASAQAYHALSLICVKHGPAVAMDVPSVDALLYHEMGHLADRTGNRLCVVLHILARGVATVLAVLAYLASILLCDRLISTLHIAIDPTRAHVYVTLVALSVWLACVCWFALRWCLASDIWRRLDMRLSHEREITANRLAVDGLLARRGDDGVRAVAAMLINLRIGADRGRKITARHPTARVELRALTDHLQAKHRIQTLFGWDDKSAGRRAMSLHRDGRPLCDATFCVFRATRRYRRRTRFLSGNGV
nr:hypothetical protein [Pandoravirus massiliensis]